jgi:hypothetical protein
MMTAVFLRAREICGDRPCPFATAPGWLAY